MPAAVSHEAPLYRAYRDEIEGDQLVRASRAAALVVIILSSAFIALDWVAFPDRFQEFLAVRLGLNVVLAVAYFRFAHTHPVASAMLGCLAIGGALLWVIEGAGGLMGEYYVGLVLLFVGMPVFMPYSVPQSALLVSTLLGALAVMPFFGGPVDWRTYLLHLFFPAAAAVECVASCAVLDRARFRDFLQRREVERAHEELKKLDIEKSRFTANVHHELRTPLTLMLAPIEAMLGGEFGEVSELQRGYVQTMHTNGLRLLKLINNLLDLAKIESQQLEIVRRPTQLGQLVDQLVAGARPLAERKEIELTARGFEALEPVCVDPEAFDKVVVNLVGNALKFTDPGGRIEVVGAPGAEGGVHLMVSDSGIGLAADQVDRIFDRFAQVDSSSTRRHEGTGIGLSLTRELVDLHGGRIWAESQGTGRGTQMHVELPAGQADANPDEEVLQSDDGSSVALGNSIAAMEGELDVEERNRNAMRTSEMQRNIERNDFGALEKDVRDPAVPAPANAPEVLICEDNADMRRLLGFLVGQEFRVRLATNGREGLERLRERAPDLVLTDVMMPEMSGTELCRAIKEDPETAGIPVVLVTSKAEREMKIEGLELGADDYVTKPFHPRELMARVRSLVKLRGLQEELSIRNALLASTNEELQATLGELREAGVQLVQAERLAAVGELAAGIAHEVNNPMNFATNALRTLNGYVSDVREVTTAIAAVDWNDAAGAARHGRELDKLTQRLAFQELTDSLMELVDIVTEGLDRTHKLVGDLRDFAAPGDGRRAEVDLLRGLQTTTQLLGHMTREAGIELQLELPEQLPFIEGDPKALNQVFLNLLKNAADVLLERGGTIRLEARSDDREVVVEVTDDGPGIDAEAVTRIFEPFYSTKEPGRGTGLGLSISHRIVKAHGGGIDVDSEPGRGSTFRVRLPLRIEADAS